MLRRILAVILVLSITALADGGNTFTRVRYNGGSVASKVKPDDWNNKLTVTSDTITFELKDGQKLEIPAKSVTGLSYGQEAHRRVGTMIALAVLVAPVALFGLFHKTRLHFIGVQYNTPDHKSGGILLQGDKDNYRAMLVALQSVSGVPVSVAEKEREFIPVGVTTNVTKGGDDSDKSAASTPTEGAAKAELIPASATVVGTVQVTSNPDGADVYSDGSFVGNAPSTLKLAPGKHTVSVKSAGHKDWSREITVQSGSEVKLNAVLEKQ
ncbi:MAG TPA: PEGA domain-containing protein [Terriglobales bacterium]|nr:PEGA domain-containing protein [Terriglobales bacterium]